MKCCDLFYFFCSSRRRHTRYWRDWSSGRVLFRSEELADGQETLEALALEDPLTGLPNKRAFQARLEAELGRAAREYYPVSIVAMDLDKFKQINDTWGHAVGDEALKRLSKELQRQLRAGDLCGRLGGDEFMLALVRADAATAEKVLQRIKDALGPVEVGPGRQKLKFSAGIAEFPRHATEMKTVIHRSEERRVGKEC